MEQRLHSALAPVDILTRLEMEQIQRKGMEAYFHQEALGVSYMEKNGNGDNATTVTIPGPDSGYSWSLKLVSAVMPAGTGGTDEIGIYLGESASSAPVGGGSAVSRGQLATVITTFTSNVVVVQDGRSVTLLGTSGIGAWKLIAKQVPSEMVAKL